MAWTVGTDRTPTRKVARHSSSLHYSITAAQATGETKEFLYRRRYARSGILSNSMLAPL